jgi:predicted AAA+ superfamily ATPase
MLAHQHGQLFNASSLAVAMGGISPITVGRYLDIFCDALIVRKVEPYFVNLGKRLVKSPKIYFRDTGLLHALLGIGNADDLQGHPMSGYSWEGLVVNHIAALLPFFLVASSSAIAHSVLPNPVGPTRICDLCPAANPSLSICMALS